ncbi:MAG: hypothetical protein RR320_07530, partial [Oscillospiraceae bacterium]
ALDVKVLDKDDKEIDLKQNFDDDDNMGLTPAEGELFAPGVEVDGELAKGGFGVENADGEPEAEETFEDDLAAFDDLGFDDESTEEKFED